MRVLLINNFHYLRGGSERCYFDTAKILAEKGHETAFFSMKHPQNKFSRWSKYFIDYSDYSDKNLGWGEKIKSIAKILYNFQAKKNLEKLILKFRPEVAHLHNIYHYLSPSVIHTLKKYNIPIVVTLHDYKLISPNRELYLRGEIWEKSKPAKYYKCFFDKCAKDSYLKSLVCVLEAYLHKFLKIYERVDIFVSPSQFLIDKFKDYGFKKEIIKIPNPIVNQPDILSGQAGEYILYFGRLSQEKGIADLIEAYARVKTDCKLYIVGEGPERKNLEDLTKNKDLVNEIIFKGYKSGPNLWQLVNKAKFIVFPSRWYENSPYSVIEAMGLKKIVICANLGGTGELIKNRITGFLYKVGNIEELANIMKDLVENSSKYGKIGRNAEKLIKMRNNKYSYYNSLIKIYLRLLNLKKEQ